MSNHSPCTPVRLDLVDKGGCSACVVFGKGESWAITEADSGFDLATASFSLARGPEDFLCIPLPYSSWLLTSHGLQCMADSFHEGSLISTLERYMELCGLVSAEESIILSPNLWLEASSI